jgi:phosphohistidine phosphatase SixA
MANAIAKAMVAAGEIPNVVFCSPYTRATQTADTYGRAFGVRVNVVDDLSPDRPLEDRILELIELCEIKKLMLVGHVDNTSPAMGNLGSDKWPALVMGEVRRVNMDRKSGDWTLKWAIKPSDLGLRDIKG